MVTVETFRRHPLMTALEVAAIAAYAVVFGVADVGAWPTILSGVVLLVALCLATARVIVADHRHGETAPSAARERRHGVAGA
jgi:hypothetical protein